MPSPSDQPVSLCVNCGGRAQPRSDYQQLARAVVASVSERTAVELLDAADEIARQTRMTPVLVLEEMLDALADDAVALYLRHPEELPRA